MRLPKGPSIPFGQGRGQLPGGEVAAFIDKIIKIVKSISYGYLIAVTNEALADAARCLAGSLLYQRRSI